MVAPSFGDIFRQNALKNGLLPVAVDDPIEDGVTLAIDLATASVTLPTGMTTSFAIDPFAQKCLLSGQDELSYLLSHADRVEAYERAH